MSQRLALAVSLVFLLSVPAISAQAQSAAEIDWRTSEQLSAIEQAGQPYYCRGKYIQPPRADYPAVNQPASRIYATAREVTYEQKHKVTLVGNVIMTQGRQSARSPRIEQDIRSQTSAMDGPLIIREQGLLLTGEHAISNLANGSGTISQATFLIHDANMRGNAAQLIRQPNGHILMDNASLTSCAPDSNLWSMRGKDITLDVEKGFGTARDLTINIKGVPVFYTPYLRFPIDDRRQSGFLLPSIGYDSAGGTDINIPYYFNLHPQYDATYQLRSLWQRGIIHDTQFRFKSKSSLNEINMAFLNGDNIYVGRQISGPTSAGIDSATVAMPALKKQDRWLLNLRHDGGWTSRWKTHLSYSAVSDIDYLYDFGGNLGSGSSKNYTSAAAASLINRRSAALDRLGRIQYRGEGWNAELSAQGFQSLALLGSTQYEKLPALKANWGEKIGRVNISGKFDYTFFEKRNTDDVIGERAYIDLEAAWPLRNIWGFLEPKIGVIHRAYQLDNTAPGADSNPEITTGRFSINAGLYFDRFLKLGAANVQQTLEPRLYYLYVEEDAQNNLPAFDVGATTPSYTSIFRHNRFSGFDRIADARQVTLGLTSRFLSKDTGAEFFSASIGQIYYLQDRSVNFRPTAVDNPKATESALFTEARVNLHASLAISGALEWEPSVGRTNRASFSLKYHSEDHSKLLNINHIYTAEEIQASSLQTISEESNINIIWPLKGHWSLIGLWNFSWDDNKTIESFYGLEYNNCCWKTRLVARRFLKEPRFVSVFVDDPNSPRGESVVSAFKRPSETGIFFEFQLKGLATLGRRLDALLENGIPGYRARENRIGL